MNFQINKDYYINEIGEIYSTKNSQVKKMKTNISSHGYFNVRLMIDGKSKMLYIHRLLAIAFISNPENKPCVNHKDGNKLNNSISNLEWATYSENNKHAFDNGLKKPSIVLSRFKNVIVTSLDGFIIGVFENIKECADYLGINQRRVSEFLSNKRTHNKYLFL